VKHPRTIIRQAVATRLSANLPEVDSRINESRVNVHRTMPLFPGKLPAVLIYTRDESIEREPNTDPGLRYRKLHLDIEIAASGKDAAEEVDALALGIESILEEDETLGNMVEGIRLTRTEIEHDPDGEVPVTAARMSYEIMYWTQLGIEKEEQSRPTQVLVGWSPDIGLPHKEDYHPSQDAIPTE
jgi:hypothetical protein